MVHKGGNSLCHETVINPMAAYMSEDALKAKGAKLMWHKKFRWICDGCGTEYEYRALAENCERIDARTHELFEAFLNEALRCVELDNPAPFTSYKTYLEARQYGGWLYDYDLVRFSEHITQRIHNLLVENKYLKRNDTTVPLCLGLYWENLARIEYLRKLLVSIKDVKNYDGLAGIMRTLPHVMTYRSPAYAEYVANRMTVANRGMEG